MAHRVDGEVVKIEGDPQNPKNYGKICAKGNSAFLNIYNPRRVTSPLRRTNQNKGWDADPKFEAIDWNEAVDIAAEQLRKVRNEDARRLYFTSFDIFNWNFYEGWMYGFGSTFVPYSSDFYCGNNVHPIHAISEISFEADPDSDYCKYLLLVGSQFGSVVNYDTMKAAVGIARKRPGGIKVVAVDPVCTYSASKAEEWVPIRPGTDASFLLALTNLLVNEYKIYDSYYVKHRTNGPYLVGNDGRYIREARSNKPLIWDPAEKKAKPYDDKTIADLALEGSYVVGDIQCEPAFQKLKNHVRKYTPEHVSEVTTVPAETIRRIAREFGEAASIGSTIDIQGVKMPYRPVACVWYRGLSAHKHSFLSGMAAENLNVLMGAVDTPGGLLGAFLLDPIVSKEGLLAGGIMGQDCTFFGAYPPREVGPPKDIHLFSLFPVAVYSRSLMYLSMLKPEVYKPPYTIGMLIAHRGNFVKSAGPRDVAEKVLKKIPFILSFSTELDETTHYADVVFPDLHYLERLAMFPILPSYVFLGNRSGLGPNYFYGQKPVVKPIFSPPWIKNFLNINQILLEIADRAGFLGDVYSGLNHVWSLKEPYTLQTDAKYSFEELCDRYLKNLLGPDYGLQWFLDDGLYLKERTPQEMYRGPFLDGRLHLYYEFMVETRKQVEKVAQELNIPWDSTDYQPLPDWKPCPAYDNDGLKGFDLYLVNYKVPQQSFSHFRSNPMLQQLTERHRDDYVLINTETAKRYDIIDEDVIWVENNYGVKAKSKARVTELIHPEVVACQGGGGRFAKNLDKDGLGINFNNMVRYDEEHLDFVSTAVDSCVRVKVYKPTESTKNAIPEKPHLTESLTA